MISGIYHSNERLGRFKIRTPFLILARLRWSWSFSVLFPAPSSSSSSTAFQLGSQLPPKDGGLWPFPTSSASSPSLAWALLSLAFGLWTGISFSFGSVNNVLDTGDRSISKTSCKVRVAKAFEVCPTSQTEKSRIRVTKSTVLESVLSIFREKSQISKQNSRYLRRSIYFYSIYFYSC